MTARARWSRWSRTARASSSAAAGDKVDHPDQPDALLRRKRRPDRRRRKDQLRQGLARPMLRTRRSRSASSTRIMRVIRAGAVAVGDAVHLAVDAERRDQGPRQSQRHPSAPRGAAQAARRPCHAEGQPGRAGPFPLRFLASQAADAARRSRRSRPT